jgi:hypothetical protein
MTIIRNRPTRKSRGWSYQPGEVLLLELTNATTLPAQTQFRETLSELEEARELGERFSGNDGAGRRAYLLGRGYTPNGVER